MRLWWLFFWVTSLSIAQQSYHLKPGIEKAEIPFKFVSNLIVIPVEINGIQLNMIFDTGVKQTLLFNIKTPDTLQLQNLKTRIFAGIGKRDTAITGASSTHNKLRIKNLILNNNTNIYLIPDLDFHFSENIGFPVNGLIGGDLIQHFILKIDYKRKILTFYKRSNFDFNSLRKAHVYMLETLDGKPFFKARVQTDKKHSPSKPLRFLLDTGNSDAVWVFDRNKIDLSPQQKKVRDYFGLGFSGPIEGDRIKIFKFWLDKKYYFKHVYAGLPDLDYFKHIMNKNAFDGIIGNEILKRFYIWIDYQGQMLYLKKYPKNYRSSFTFNEIGINLAYDGKIPIRIKKLHTQFNTKMEAGKTFIYEDVAQVYQYKFVDRFIINYIRKDSPADRAGLMHGDILLKINNVEIYRYTLEELEKKFFYHNRKHLTVLIKRKGLVLTFDIYNNEHL